jgi:hypothetical protein
LDLALPTTAACARTGLIGRECRPAGSDRPCRDRESGPRPGRPSRLAADHPIAPCANASSPVEAPPRTVESLRPQPRPARTRPPPSKRPAPRARRTPPRDRPQHDRRPRPLRPTLERQVQRHPTHHPRQRTPGDHQCRIQPARTAHQDEQAPKRHQRPDDWRAAGRGSRTRRFAQACDDVWAPPARHEDPARSSPGQSAPPDPHDVVAERSWTSRKAAEFIATPPPGSTATRRRTTCCGPVGCPVSSAPA